MPPKRKGKRKAVGNEGEEDVSKGLVSVEMAAQHITDLGHLPLDISRLVAALARAPVVVVTASEDDKVRIWDADAGTCMLVLVSEIRVPRVLALPGSRLVSSSFDGEIRLWDLISGACTRVLSGHQDLVTQVCYTSIEGQEVIISGSNDESVRVWSLQTGRCLRVLDCSDGGAVTALAVSPNGRLLVTGGVCGQMKLWNIESIISIASTFKFGFGIDDDSTAILSIYFSADSTSVVSASDLEEPYRWNIDAAYIAEKISLGWVGGDRNSGEELDLGEGVDRMTADSNNHRAVVCYERNGEESGRATGVKLVDMVTQRDLQVLEGHTGVLARLAFSPDFGTILSASDDGHVRFWNSLTGDMLANVLKMPEGERRDWTNTSWLRITPVEEPPRDVPLLASITIYFSPADRHLMAESSNLREKLKRVGEKRGGILENYDERTGLLTGHAFNLPTLAQGLRISLSIIGGVEVLERIDGDDGARKHNGCTDASFLPTCGLSNTATSEIFGVFR
jgi:WD40 repeat protein